MKQGRQSGSGSGKRLGRREKKLLLAMLEHDDPPGEDTIWDDICGKLRIFFSDIVPKNVFKEKYVEERKYKRAMWRLLKKNLARNVITELGLKLRGGRGSGYLFFALTKTGRKVAEELKKQEDIKEDLKTTLKLLTKQGYKHITLKQICELLWRLSHDKFKNREEFDKYWNNRRLGLTLKKMGIKKIRIQEKQIRIYKYNLPRVSPIKP